MENKRQTLHKSNDVKGVPGMEEIAGDLSRMLNKLLTLYRELLEVIETEKIHIKDMNLDGMWQTTGRKKELTRETLELMVSVMRCFPFYAQISPSDIKEFSLMASLNRLSLPLTQKSKIKTVVMDIEACKKEITAKATLNRTFIQESLSMINTIIGKVAKKKNREQYSNHGQVLQGRNNYRLIHTEV